MVEGVEGDLCSRFNPLRRGGVVVEAEAGGSETAAVGVAVVGAGPVAGTGGAAAGAGGAAAADRGTTARKHPKRNVLRVLPRFTSARSREAPARLWAR